MEHNAFLEISLILAIATVVSIFARLLRQPLIIGYILTGILVGPALLDIVHSESTVDTFASLGVALLLFIIGLGLNPQVIKEVGKVAILTGLGQIIFTTSFGYAIVRGMGYEHGPAIFIGLALAFSSTIIVLKLITDKHEQTRLYAKISIGFLLVQDLVATFALLVTSAASEGSGVSTSELFALVIKGTWMAALLAIVSIEILPRLVGYVSKNQELLFLFAIGWGFGIASLFANAGFSIEVGALIAGVTLAPLPYAAEIGSRLRPLRDFFLVVFFIVLGSRLAFDSLGEVVGPALLLSAFVLIGNPIIVMTIMGVLGYTKKTAFKAGLAVAQISEFSLVLILLAQRGELVNDQVVALVTLVALITIAASSYLIIYADGIYLFLERYLQLFERRKTKSDRTSGHQYDLILFGFRRGGNEFLSTFKAMKRKYVVVDYDPEAIDTLEHLGAHYLYGDATDPEFLEEIELSKAKLVVSVITDHPSNMYLIKHLEAINPDAVTICHSDSATEASELYEAGATYVMMPHYLGSEKISAFVKKNGLKKSEFKKQREKHLEYLQSHHE